MSASAVANRIDAPRPCTAREAISQPMSGARPQAADDALNRTRPIANALRRPLRSASTPAVSTVAASGSVYASTTHCRPDSPVSRSSAMCESAVLTTLMSSMSITVARQATAIVRVRLRVTVMAHNARAPAAARLSRRWGRGAQDVPPQVRGVHPAVAALPSPAMKSATKALAAREAIVSLAGDLHDPLELLDEVRRRVGRTIPNDGGGWMLTDPQTIVPTALIGDSDDRELSRRFFEHELFVPDVNAFGDLHRRGVTVTSLSEATNGRPELSPRYRDIHVPFGLGPEARMLFRTGDATW